MRTTTVRVIRRDWRGPCVPLVPAAVAHVRVWGIGVGVADSDCDKFLLSPVIVLGNDLSGGAFRLNKDISGRPRIVSEVL